MNRRYGKGFIFPLTFTLAVERAWTLETDLGSNPRLPLTQLWHINQVTYLFSDYLFVKLKIIPNLEVVVRLNRDNKVASKHPQSGSYNYNFSFYYLKCHCHRASCV